MSLYQRLIKANWLPEYQSKSIYAWFGMLVFFIWKYFVTTASALEISLAIITIPLFIFLYIGSFWQHGSASIGMVLLMFLLGVAWASNNPGSSVFVVFAAATCATITPIRRAYATLGMVLVLVLVSVVVLKLSPEFWVPGFVVSGTIGLASIMQSTLRRSQQKLIRSQEEVAHLATIAERERISRDLHDLLGHTLSLITIKAELAGKLIGRDLDACRQEIADIEKTARNALSEVRAAVTGYRQVGLTHELANAASCLSAVNIALSTHIDNVHLSAASENILSLALREAITNVARHSGANQCDIFLGTEGNWIVLTIKDNGTGLTADTELKLGNGLTGMRERVAGIGGQIILQGQQGLCLLIQVPKNQQKSEGANA